MALEDKKLPPDLKPDETIAAAIRARLEAGRLTCSAAFAVAEEVGCPPAAVGEAADVLTIRLTRCQLGLFGFPGHAKGWEAAGVASLPVAEGLEQAIREHEGGQGNVACEDLWIVAARFGASRMQVGYLADRLGIPIRPCQLGAF
jgi:hypothetical protein